MQGINISSDRVITAGAGVTDVSTSLAKEITTMGEQLADIQSGWQSDQAAPRFASTMQGYLDQATVLKDALVSHGATLDTTGRKWAEAEASLAASIPAGA